MELYVEGRKGDFDCVELKISLYSLFLLVFLL